MKMKTSSTNPSGVEGRTKLIVLKNRWGQQRFCAEDIIDRSFYIHSCYLKFLLVSPEVWKRENPMLSRLERWQRMEQIHESCHLLFACYGFSADRRPTNTYASTCGEPILNPCHLVIAWTCAHGAASACVCGLRGRKTCLWLYRAKIKLSRRPGVVPDKLINVGTACGKLSG